MSIKLPASITRFGGNLKLKANKNMPEILLAVGVISGIATVVVACRQTIKAADVIEDFKDEMSDIKEAKRLHDCGGVVEIDEDGTEYKSTAADNYDDKAYRMDVALAYKDVAWGLTKAYAPAILLGGLSIASILTSHGILKRRELAAIATSAAIRQAFDEYRSRVREHVGDDVERKIYSGRYETTREIESKDEKGEPIAKTVRYELSSTGSPYSRIFDEFVGDEWHKSGTVNYSTLISDLKFLNYKLIADGHLFLNDVYKQIGFQQTCHGQMAGWIYNPDNPDGSLLKFAGMEDLEFTDQGTILVNVSTMSDDWKALKNDYERSILIDFVNIQDNILEDLPRVDSKFSVI